MFIIIGLSKITGKHSFSLFLMYFRAKPDVHLRAILQYCDAMLQY